MRWFKREMWKAGIAVASTVLFLGLMVWVPVLAAGAYERASGLVGPGTATVQATPTVDATVTVLSKEQLTQQIKQLQLQNDRSIAAWFWNVGTTLGTIVAALIAVVGVFATVRFNSQKELNDRQAERDKRAEERLKERFEALSSIVTGLGDEKEGAKVGAAILLRTFLRPGYEGFYTQIFQLVAANLRLPRTPTPPEDSAAPLPLTALSQALMIAFMEAFPLAQEQEKKTMGTKLADNEDKVRSTHPAPVTLSSTEIRSLNALGILLYNGFLWYANLRQAWMPYASLRNTDLTGLI